MNVQRVGGLVCALAVAIGAQGAAAQEKADLAPVVEQILQQTSEFRAGQMLPSLRINETLVAAAQAHADFMARTDQFSHTADNKRPHQRAEDRGYKACIVAENIGYKRASAGLFPEEMARRLIEDWKASPVHRANLADPDVTETGVALAHSSTSGRYYAVQLLGRPVSLKVSLKIENRADEPVEYKFSDQTFRLEPGSTQTHEQCRPADVQFTRPATLQPRTERVASRTHLVIQRSRDDGLTVSRESSAGKLR